MPQKKKQANDSKDLQPERQETKAVSNFKKYKKFNKLLDKFTKSFNNSNPDNLELWKAITPENLLIYAFIFHWYESSGKVLLEKPVLLKPFHQAYVDFMTKKDYPFVANVTFLKYLKNIVIAIKVKKHGSGTQLYKETVKTEY